MILLDIKLAVKKLYHSKSNAFVSIAGLAIAFITVFFIYSYVSFELNYDSHHKNGDRIYRIEGKISTAENEVVHAKLGPLMGMGLIEFFPFVESAVSLFPSRQSLTVEIDNSKHRLPDVYYTSNNIFDIFSFDFIFGSSETALSSPSEIVLNQTISHKIFGDQNPLGMTMISDTTILTVVGVIKDSPNNSHHKFNVLISNAHTLTNANDNIDVRLSEAYWRPSAFHFVILSKDAKIEQLYKGFAPFYQKYMSPFGNALGATFSIMATPLHDVHFSPYMNYDYPKGNRLHSYLLIVVAFFIMIIAIINYSNLLLSQNISQSVGFGVRKILGAKNLDIFIQLIINSFTFLLFSALLAMLTFHLVLPYSTTITGLTLSDFSPAKLVILSLILCVALSPVTALMPFFAQARRNGLDLIRWKRGTNRVGSLKFGQLSTIFQITLSVILIISSFFIARQLNFLMSQDIGFNKEDVISIRMNDSSIDADDITLFKRELLANSAVFSTAYSTYLPGDMLGSTTFPKYSNGEMSHTVVRWNGVDDDFISLMGMELIEGQNFQPTLNDKESNNIIVNQALVDFCGLTGDFVGSKFNESATVIGVVKNAAFNSLHNPTEPMVFSFELRPYGYVSIKVDSHNIQETLGYVKSTYKKVFGDIPFEFQFLDEKVSTMYSEDYRISALLSFFTLISIILSVMGLANLSSIITKQRTKEIGIRKVNGAKIIEILVMLNMDFIKWVAIAFVIAVPIAWYAMNSWLQNFAYKTELSWWIFALAGIMALFIALLTVSLQTFKVSRKNPVEALRYE